MMKKRLLYVIGLALLHLNLFAAEPAGSPAKVWSLPVIYNLDQQTTFYFDLTGTAFEAGQDIYLWVWQPSEPDAGNWENSSDFAKLTYVGDMVWKKDMVPTQYFGMTADAIREKEMPFWMKLKDKTGDLEIADAFNIPLPDDISKFVESGKIVDVYPKSFVVNTPISIVFNSNLVTGFAGAASVHLHSGANAWANSIEYHAWETEGNAPESANYTQAVDMGNGIYRKDMVPFEYYLVDETYPLENIVGLFVAKDWAATCPDFTLYAADVPLPPEPVLSFFPNKISNKDIFRIQRTWNSDGQTPLKYKITDGQTIVEGEFEGKQSEQNAYIYIPASFGNTSATRLNVTITDAKGFEITNEDIMLIVAD